LFHFFKVKFKRKKKPLNKRISLQKNLSFLKKTIFSTSSVGLRYLVLHLKRFLFKQLRYPVHLKIKNVFFLKRKKTHRIFKKNKAFSYFSLVSLQVYKKSQTFHKLWFFLYLKDMINILNCAFFFHKSELVSSYISDLIKGRNRRFLRDLTSIKSLLLLFKGYYGFTFGSAIRIYVLGKMKGQKSRRFRRFVLKSGLSFSTQNPSKNVSFSLAQT
jgi:hypothetical protein